MKLENQVSNKELSKKLKELGIKQESLWKWRLAGNLGWQIERHFSPIMVEEKQYSAFTVAELGELLPIYYSTFFDGKNWCVDEEGCKLEDVFELLEAKTEADARAKILIHLIENKLMK